MSDVAERARAFGERHVAPFAARWELERRQPTDAFRHAGDAGLTGLLVDRILGGAGVGCGEASAAFEALGRSCIPFAFALAVQNNLATGIARAGSDAQRAELLPALLAGELVGAFCLTEPGAGSDAAAIATTARRVEGGWLLSGEKAWVSNAATAGVFSVYAQTQPGAGRAGIGAWLVRAGDPGLEVAPPDALAGGHVLGTGGLVLRDCRVRDGALFHAPGAGLSAALDGIDLGRLFIAAICCGALAASLEVALDHAAARQAFGRSTLSFQGVQFPLADVATELEAARALVARAARALDAAATGGRVEAAHAKKFATRAAQRGVQACMHAMGAAGYRVEHPLGRHLAGVQMAQFLDGTAEIQNVVIARALARARGLTLDA